MSGRGIVVTSVTGFTYTVRVVRDGEFRFHWVSGILNSPTDTVPWAVARWVLWTGAVLLLFRPLRETSHTCFAIGFVGLWVSIIVSGIQLSVFGIPGDGTTLHTAHQVLTAVFGFYCVFYFWSICYRRVCAIWFALGCVTLVLYVLDRTTVANIHQNYFISLEYLLFAQVVGVALYAYSGNQVDNNPQTTSTAIPPAVRLTIPSLERAQRLARI